MKLRNELYLELFSYMPAKSAIGSQNELRLWKAISYIPVFGTVAYVGMSLMAFREGKRETKPQDRQEKKIQGTLLGLRATLSLAPPLSRRHSSFEKAPLDDGKIAT